MIGNLLDRCVQTTQNPTVCQIPLVFSRQFWCILHVTKIHDYITAGIPDLVDKVPGCIHLLVGETNVLTWRRTRNQEPAQSIRTILFDDVHWINPVTQRLTHLTALLITNQAVQQDIAEWCLAGKFQ